MYHSEEIYNAEKFGYKFKILRGYLFDKDFIFRDYVDFLYNLKMNSTKDSPNYTISKLLMNSLYGKFGMNPKMINHIIVTNEESNYILNNFEVKDIISLNNNKLLISYIILDNNNNNNNNNNNINDFTEMNISIPIAASITAYSRIFMSKFKSVNNDFNLYYSDTDSIDIDKPLDENLIGKDLGKMKLEHIFEEIIFLAPKTYGGKTSNYEFVKVKGLKTHIQFEELKNLLIKNNKLNINQDKWYKDFSSGYINIKNEIYTLMITENKRKFIFDNKNKFIDTIPYVIKNGELI
jgi:hypothetical protein